MFHNSRERRLKRKRMIIAGLSVAAVLFLAVIFFLWHHQSVPTVTIHIEDVSIYPDEEMPAFQANIEVEESVKKIVLDKRSGYTVRDLIRELKEIYRFECDYDPEVPEDEDGKVKKEYPIRLALAEEIKKRVEKTWKNQVRLEVIEGTLMIKNSLGEWEEDRFRYRDGTYASNKFLYLDDETYYVDEDGRKVTGEQEIWGRKFYFDQNGVLEREEDGIDPSRPMIALTFDDGPGKDTERLLDALEKHGARATFFMVKSNITKYPDTVKRMKEIGCEIGNHTTDHKRLTELAEAEIVSQVETTNAALKSLIGEGATVVRPPYGMVNDLVKSTIKYPLIFWNVDTLDWETRDAGKTVKHTLENVKDGDIVLMHDIYETTIDAAIELIEKLQEAGYQLVTVSEMARARGIELEMGEEYTRLRPVQNTENTEIQKSGTQN